MDTVRYLLHVAVNGSDLVELEILGAFWSGAGVMK
jgi:hypothetical protein